MTNDELLGILLSRLDEFVIVLCDTSGNFTSWHPGVLAQFGYTAEEFIGQNLALLYPPADPNGRVERELATAAEKGRASDTSWLAKKTGEIMWVDGVIIALRAPDGTLLGFGKVLRDVTPRLRSQQDLEAANERMRRMTHELSRSNEELEEFARIASHDLRAPLTTTRWLTDLLSFRHSGELDEEGRTCLQQIGRSLERMTGLVDAILAHAQVGQTAIGSLEETDTEAAILVALENLGGDIVMSNAAIRYENLPPVAVQPQALTQLFQNLLGNAIKYRRSGIPPEIRITGRRESARCVFAIEDNGIGIEDEWKERIFLPLQRRSEKGSGSGLGLATCKKIVTRAGGEIWVESKVGAGSTFYFTLPVSPISEASEGT
ncbi:MAG TPA: ATP-binding protein [Bryobacteraceae bacterium]